MWWPRSSAPSCDRAGQTHRLVLHRAVVSSDKFSYWPAETSSYLQKNHIHDFFLFTLWKNKHLNKMWPLQAVLIVSWTPFNKDVVMAAREQWHNMTTTLASRPPSPLLTRPPVTTPEVPRKHILASTPSHQRVKIWSHLNKALPYSLSLAAKSQLSSLFSCALPPGRHFTILIKKNTHS